jgi:hypothetical protein
MCLTGLDFPRAIVVLGRGARRGQHVLHAVDTASAIRHAADH